MRKLFIFTIIIAIFSGCTTARLNQFKQFAEAGRIYADAVEVLADEAGQTAIDTDSIVLMKVRDSLSSKERSKTIVEHNALLKERLSLLNDLRRHARLLKSYFTSLALLAKSNASSGIGTATESVVTSLGEIHARIKKAHVGGQAVDDFTGTVVNIAVGQFHRSALEKELKARSAVIERELDLQLAALEVIADQMRTDLTASLYQLESTDIVRPYRSNTRLSNNWVKRRKELLTTHLSLASADAAVEAARHLKLSFIALVENRVDTSDIDFLINDINEILVLTETFRKK